jgi:cytochrome c556
MRVVTCVSAIFLVLGIGAALAEIDPIATRREIMKGVGSATGDLGKMAKGEAPFDLTKVKAALKTYADASAKMKNLFPDTSMQGGDTHALPKIWQDKADFDARFEKFGKESMAAQSTIKDAATFRPTFAALAKNCGSCHELYRAAIH